MNIIFVSPNFPPNYERFCIHLRALGANVLGLSDQPYDTLTNELRAALTEYYLVPDLHNYDELLRGVGFFTHRYGKIDRIESLNEHWLETEARLRTDFNVPGFRLADLPAIKRKSEMKRMFAAAGVETARAITADDAEQVRAFAAGRQARHWCWCNTHLCDRQPERARRFSAATIQRLSARRIRPRHDPDLRRPDRP